MTIKWFSPALHDLKHIKKYCKQKFGNDVADYSIERIKQAINLLSSHPHIGLIEPLLLHRAEEWRSFVVHKNTKVVYLIGSKTINIGALWDTRQRPIKLVNYIDRLVQTEPSVLNEPSVPYIAIPKTK